MGKFVKGQKKTGGRTKGVVNKDSRMVLDAIESVYEGVGGNGYLLKFAQENPEAFLTRIWVKLLPMQVNVKVSNDFTHILEAARNRAVTKIEGDRVG
jgi:hypothetical protein